MCADGTFPGAEQHSEASEKDGMNPSFFLSQRDVQDHHQAEAKRE